MIDVLECKKPYGKSLTSRAWSSRTNGLSLKQGTGNGEWEWRTGNGERGNGERGTGNGERGIFKMGNL